MADEKITVRVTETGQTMDLVVLDKRADRIEVVLGRRRPQREVRAQPDAQCVGICGERQRT